MDYFSGWCKSERRLEGITAIVTGANSGIGLQSALDFYQRGGRVILACRNLERAEEAAHVIEESAKDNSTKNGTLSKEYLNLCSLESVRKFSSAVLAREKRIQILVNNAGVMCCPESRTEDGFETHIGVNHFGHAMLTLLLLPKLIDSAPSRIIFVSSDIHYFHKLDFDDINYQNTPYSPLEAYSRSKIANVVFAKALALKLKENDIKGVTTYSLHPGIVFTEIDRYFLPLISWGYRLSLMRWMWKSARCGAQTSVYCAVDESCADETGLYYSDCAPCPPSSFCQNNENAIKLWNLTIQMLSMKNYNPFTVAKTL